MNPLQAILFDFDGVLADSVDVKTKAFAALYEPYGDQVVKGVIDYHLANGGVSRFEKFRYYHRELLKKTLSQNEEDELCRRFSDIVEREVINAPAIAGSQEYLSRHWQEADFYIVSGTPTDEMVRIAKGRNIYDYFKGIYGSPTTKDIIVRQILEENDYDPNRVLMIGDAMSDFGASRENKIHFVGRAIGDQHPFPTGTFCIPDLTEFATVVSDCSQDKGAT